MDFKAYKQIVSQIEIGKKLPDAVYLHQSAFPWIPPELPALLERTIEECALKEFVFNIAKFHSRDFKISLLHYPTFFEEAYPALVQSCTIDLMTQKYRISSYKNSQNPPILHRKETFLAPDHPAISLFEELTQEGEAAGLYENTSKIGFKQSWERLIQQKGYQLVQGRLLKTDPEAEEPANQEIASKNEDFQANAPLQIARHKTAIERYALSSPMQSLANHHYLNGNYTIFDYGCGKGDDLRELQAHGLEAMGWDPVYFPETPKKHADIVNLGFVINVIEDPQERADSLKQAYGLANKFLVVAVMLGSAATLEKFRPYKDGVITNRNTFQKYYAQQELRAYLEQVLQAAPIAVRPGVFYLFKDELEEQTFLSNRQRRREDWKMLSQRQHRVLPKAEKVSFYEKHQPLLEDFWQLCLELGRVPVTSEFEFSSKIRSLLGSMKKAHTSLCDYHGMAIFETAQQNRRDDLSVYFALSSFGQKKSYTHLPHGLKRDVKEFFGDYAGAMAHGRELLFSVGNPKVIQEACDQAATEMEIGFLENGHSLQLHVSQITQLPPPLRVYVGCATQLYGDVEHCDLLKIHIHSGKVTLLKYDDFANKAIPELLQRIKIKLRDQEIDFFDYGEPFEPQPLYLKSRYLPESFQNYKKQKKFDETLLNLNLFDFSGFGPKKADFYSKLEANEYALNGFHIIKND